MQIIITLDLTNDPDEIGVQLAGLSNSIIDAAFEAVEGLGLKTDRLLVTGIGAKIAGTS